MECYCFLRNAVDELVTNYTRKHKGGVAMTPYEQRYKAPYAGPKIPFGALVGYRRSIPADRKAMHAFAQTLQRGIFAGYDVKAGGSWNSALIIVDVDQPEAARTVPEVHPRVVRHEKVFSA